MKKREELDKYRELPDDELRAETARLKESLFRLNFKLALGEVDAVKRIREEKRSLARISTLMRQRELQQA
jgi:large subunit ribosomal protein L29